MKLSTVQKPLTFMYKFKFFRLGGSSIQRKKECVITFQGIKLNVATSAEDNSLMWTKVEFHSIMAIGLNSISTITSNTLKADQLVFTNKETKAANYTSKPSHLFTAEQM
jgi:hypothetical protein